MGRRLEWQLVPRAVSSLGVPTVSTVGRSQQPPRLGSPGLRSGPCAGSGPLVTTGHERRATRPARPTRTRTRSNEKRWGDEPAQNQEAKHTSGRACENPHFTVAGASSGQIRAKRPSRAGRWHTNLSDGLLFKLGGLGSPRRLSGLGQARTKPPPAGETLDHRKSTASRVQGAAEGAVPPEVYAFAHHLNGPAVQPGRSYTRPLCILPIRASGEPRGS
jgi:hypothetical protein